MSPSKSSHAGLATISVKVRDLLGDWRQKQKVQKEFIAVQRTAKRVFQKDAELRELEVPLMRLEKEVRVLKRYGRFEGELRRLRRRKK